MTSVKQLAANRRNALKSTGPKTEEGKNRSRRNAVRHGLTAETVIGTLEDAEDDKAFEAAITADYDAQSAVERQLVLRLVGLLWRLRRATTIETGLFEIQVALQRDDTKDGHLSPMSREIVYAVLAERSLLPNHDAPTLSATAGLETADPCNTRIVVLAANRSVDLARYFLRLANLPNSTLDRLSRYEAALWRQVRQTLVTLDALDRRKPQERGGLFCTSARRRAPSLSDES
jgi:hypothetical protein